MVDASQIFVINGFYMDMRASYVKEGASIHYYLVDWDSKNLSWADFRGVVLGATDPEAAAKDSLRNDILVQFEALGLSGKPNVGDNGVHASASPFEALAERANWVGKDIASDAYGKALIESGVSLETIKAWSSDPQVELPGGGKGSLFDALEDQNCTECLATAQKIAKTEAKGVEVTQNQAFVFIKPHAVTDKVKQLVADRFKAKGINISEEGDLDAKTIDTKQLIDIHYGAIASKAMILKPTELNPPAPKQQEFADKFKTTWPEALAAGNVYNAKDACVKLGVDGTQMANLWAQTKKNKDLVKFGGGFYAGLVKKE